MLHLAFRDDPNRCLFLSTKSGGVRLNLQHASVVINCDLPWNPARLEQRIARARRKHQRRPVTVVNLIAADLAEEAEPHHHAAEKALAEVSAIERGLTLKQIVLTSLSKELEPASTGPAPGQSIKERRKLLPRYAKFEIEGAFTPRPIDRHFLAAAPLFGLRGLNVIPDLK